MREDKNRYNFKSCLKSLKNVAIFIMKFFIRQVSKKSFTYLPAKTRRVNLESNKVLKNSRLISLSLSLF